jgi:hypothetical protein
MLRISWGNPTPAVQPVACRDATDVGVIRIPVVSQLHAPTVSSRRKSPRYSLDKRLGVSQTVALYSVVLVLFRSLCSVVSVRSGRASGCWEVSPAIGKQASSSLLLASQSQSYFTTDDQSVSKSWFQGPWGSHDLIFISVDIYAPLHSNSHIYRRCHCPQNGPQSKRPRCIATAHHCLATYTQTHPARRILSLPDAHFRCQTHTFAFIYIDSDRWEGKYEWWFEKDVEESDHGILKGLSKHLPGRTKKLHKNSQSLYSVSKLRIKPRISKIWNKDANYRTVIFGLNTAFGRHLLEK